MPPAKEGDLHWSTFFPSLFIQLAVDVRFIPPTIVILYSLIVNMIFSPSFLILLFTLSAGINAAPWLESRSGVSNDVFARLKFFAQYAAAAYCAKNNNSPGDKVVCSSKDQCPQVQQASTKTVAEFQKSASPYISPVNESCLRSMTVRGQQIRQAS